MTREISPRLLILRIYKKNISKTWFFSKRSRRNFLIFCYGFPPSLQPCKPWSWDMEKVLILLKHTVQKTYFQNISRSFRSRSADSKCRRQKSFSSCGLWISIRFLDKWDLHICRRKLNRVPLFAPVEQTVQLLSAIEMS